MLKMTFLAGAGAGYVLGARAGRGRYDKIEGLAKKAAGRVALPQVEDKAAPAGNKIQMSDAERIPDGAGRPGPGNAGSGTSPAADKRIGAADGSAAEKSAAAGDLETAGSEEPGGRPAPSRSSHTGGAVSAATTPPADPDSGTPHGSNLPPRGTFSPTYGTF